MTYDVAAFQQATGDYTQALITLNNNGVAISGTLKLAQRFILELMTEKGSIPYLPTRGTTFITEAKYGELITEVDVYSSFALALLDIATNLNDEELTTDPTDESFDTAQILNVIIGNESVSLNIKIISKAGTSQNIQIPLTFNLRQ